MGRESVRASSQGKNNCFVDSPLRESGPGPIRLFQVTSIQELASGRKFAQLFLQVMRDYLLNGGLANFAQSFICDGRDRVPSEFQNAPKFLGKTMPLEETQVGNQR